MKYKKFLIHFEFYFFFKYYIIIILIVINEKLIQKNKYLSLYNLSKKIYNSNNKNYYHSINFSNSLKLVFNSQVNR